MAMHTKIREAVERVGVGARDVRLGRHRVPHEAVEQRRCSLSGLGQADIAAVGGNATGAYLPTAAKA